jgi:hypothetical protein
MLDNGIKTARRLAHTPVGAAAMQRSMSVDASLASQLKTRMIAALPDRLSDQAG